MNAIVNLEDKFMKFVFKLKLGPPYSMSDRGNFESIQNSNGRSYVHLWDNYSLFFFFTFSHDFLLYLLI